MIKRKKIWLGDNPKRFEDLINKAKNLGWQFRDENVQSKSVNCHSLYFDERFIFCGYEDNHVFKEHRYNEIRDI